MARLSLAHEVGTIGVTRAPGERGRPIHKCRRLYFSEDFLQNPPDMWTVTLPKVPEIADHLAAQGWMQLGWLSYPKGTRITYDNTHLRAIWVLTGRDFPLTASHVFEAKWPD